MIEDSASGARAAQAANMRCIGFAPNGQNATLESHCEVILNDMEAVAPLLGL